MMQEMPDTAHNGNEAPAGELAAPRSQGTQQPASPPPAPPEAAGPEERLKKAELAAAEHHDAWLRAKAEADNIRKRAQADVAIAHKFAVENITTELLAVKDSLEAALAAENATANSLKSGVELTLRQLKSVFEKFNVAEICPVGQKFDPHRHQAISTMESDADPNTVIKVLQKGYLLHDRVIRPALVIVAKSRSA
jgi:molecular chaperone GrpE